MYQTKKLYHNFQHDLLKKTKFSQESVFNQNAIPLLHLAWYSDFIKIASCYDYQIDLVRGSGKNLPTIKFYLHL